MSKPGILSPGSPGTLAQPCWDYNTPLGLVPHIQAPEHLLLLEHLCQDQRLQALMAGVGIQIATRPTVARGRPHSWRAWVSMGSHSVLHPRPGNVYSGQCRMP